MLALIGGVELSAASDPASQTVAAPAVPGAVTVTWTGTIPPGAQPLSTCSPSATNDSHTIDLQVPDGLYDSATSSATFTISWEDPTGNNDEILTVVAPDGGEVGSSDGSGASEVVNANDLAAGSYEVLACGFAAPTPQAYTGQLTFSTSARDSEPVPPSADAQGLSFSASVPADPQRDEAEPDMRVDGDGNIYTCGPTGFTGASDYAQISSDGGDQFHLIGEDPRGQQGLGGGGDCGLAMGVQRNSQGFFQYAYAGLGPLDRIHHIHLTRRRAHDHHRRAAGQHQHGPGRGRGPPVDGLPRRSNRPPELQPAGPPKRRRSEVDRRRAHLPHRERHDRLAQPGFPGTDALDARRTWSIPGQSGYVAYYGWNSSDADFSYVNFAISDTTGLDWHNCLVAKIPIADSGGLGAFTVADNDDQGNIYLTYADKKGFHSYLTTLTANKLAGCTDGTTSQPTTDPAGPRRCRSTAATSAAPSSHGWPPRESQAESRSRSTAPRPTAIRTSARSRRAGTFTSTSRSMRCRRTRR